MASNGWKSELYDLLDFIEKQSTSSFETINQHLLTAGDTFDEEIRQSICEMVNSR